MNSMSAPIALDDGQRVVSARELPEQIAAESQWLHACGARDARFAVLADNGIGWAVTDLALHTAHTLNVPVPGYFTAAQIAHVLDDAAIDVVVTDHSDRILELDRGFAVVGASPVTGLTTLVRAIAPAARSVLPAGTTKITYTSGSTGAPKGVCLAAATLETVAASLNQVTRPFATQRHLCLLPLATLLDNLAGLIAAPLAGATCVLPSLQTTGIHYGGVDVRAMLDCIVRSQPQSMILVPELLRVLVGAIDRGWRAPNSLKFIAVGGATTAPELLAHARSVGLPVLEGYGLSECASVVALNTHAENRPGSVGKPLPHARVRIDAAGEIRVAGATMLGYLGDPASAATEEIATGDLGEFDADGFLYVRGRAKNLLITSMGRNISPEWVERELLVDGTLAQVAVFGDAQPHPVALVVPANAAADSATIDSVVAAANQRLPDYARVRAWRHAAAPFSPRDGTLTTNGRLRREAILRRESQALDALYRTAIAS
jgi:long-subunit acyl-CoA synthetase (AMP-forming)